LDATFVFGAANAFAVCARATRAVKPTGAATRARNVTACIVAPSTVREMKVQIELGGTFLGCHWVSCWAFFSHSRESLQPAFILRHDSEFQVPAGRVDPNSVSTFGFIFG
jgi:hypothetical protein